MRNENRDKLRATSRRHYWSDVDRARRLGREKERARYAVDPEGARARSQLWRAANPDKVREQERKWRATDAGRRLKAISEGRRRARKRNAQGTYTLGEWQAKCAEHGGTCFYCGAAKPLTADHVVPLARGGSNRIENIVPACIGCNSSKRDADAGEWIRRRMVTGRHVTTVAMRLLASAAKKRLR